MEKHDSYSRTEEVISKKCEMHCKKIWVKVLNEWRIRSTNKKEKVTNNGQWVATQWQRAAV